MKNAEQHIWTQENLEAYLFDGLEGEEKSKLEEHLRECADCDSKFQEISSEDRNMQAAFEPVRPGSDFEERLIQQLRGQSDGTPLWQRTNYRVAAGIFALLLFGGVGYLGSRAMNKHALPELAFRFNSEPRDRRSIVGEDPSMLQNLRTPEEMAEGHASSLLGSLERPSSKLGFAQGDLPNAIISDRNKSVADAEEVPFLSDGSASNQQESGQSYLSYQDDSKKDIQLKARSEFKPSPKAKLELGGKSAPQDKKSGGVYKGPSDTFALAGAPAFEFQEGQGSGQKEAEKSEQNSAPAQRKVIRNGEIEFEVESFDSAFLQIVKIANEEGGFVATTDSQKLPDGKVRGKVVLRVPPDRLDVLVLKLRALGDVKNQKLTSQDITKAYTDLESQLRAARAMEERLLEIIKSGKGEIKDLLAAEKELGVWRGKIEQVEGEIRYYNSLVSLSTLTLTIVEKDARSAAPATEVEKVDMGVESEDVEKSYAEAMKAISEAKGRITKSELNKFDAGQFAGQIACEVSPDNAGPLTDRLKQLGRVARFNVNREQTIQEGVKRPSGVSVERKDTQINLSLYNLANVAPRETINLDIACSDVEAAYKAILARVEKANGRVVNSSLNRQKPGQISGTLNFQIPSAESEAALIDVRSNGDTIRLNRTENPDTNNVTNSKRGFLVQLFTVGLIAPRETVSMKLASKDVSDAYREILERAKKGRGRLIVSQLSEEDKNNVNGTLDFEYFKEDQEEIESLIDTQGDVYSKKTVRAGENEVVLESKFRMQLQVLSASQLAPKQTTTVGLEVSNVDTALASLQSFSAKKSGRIVESHLSREKSGRVVGKLVLDVPLGSGEELLGEIKNLGEIRMIQASQNSQVPEGKLARARFDLTIANAQLIVSGDRGVIETIKDGLASSFSGLMWSLNLIVIGICFVGPWLLIAALAWKIIRRRGSKTAE